MTDKTNIYILKLQNSKYYIGKSNNIEKRYKEHISGLGSVWTKKYKPIKIEKIIKNASIYDEDRYVKEYMAKYGLDNVRGGAYSSMKLSDDQICSLAKEFIATNDLCTRCGRSGHFIKDCYAKKDVFLNNIDSSSPSSDSESDKENEIDSCKTKLLKKKACYRCGYNNHFIKDCYAKKDISGNDLGSDSDSDSDN